MHRLAAVDVTGGVSRAWANVATFVPKFVAFLIILLVGWLIAKAVEKVLARVLVRVGFDRLVERGGVKKALARSEYDAAGLLGKVVYYMIILFTLSTAFGVFGSNPVSIYLRAVIAYLPKVFAAILIVVVAAAVAAALRNVVTDLLGGLSYGSVLAGLCAGLVLFFGVIAALDQLQIARTVVDAVLYAVLAALVGVTVVAVGGGGIRAMQTRWDRMLARLDDEAPNVRAAVDSNRDRVRAAYPRDGQSVTAASRPAAHRLDS